MKTKLVVRRIPADVSEEAVTESIQPFAHLYDRYWFCEPPLVRNYSRRRKIKHNRFYIHFPTPEQAREFIVAYRDVELPTSGGATIKPMIEFAPSQAMPRKNRKVDRRMDSIGSDSDYIRFVESLEDGVLRHEPIIETPQSQVLAGMEAACSAHNISKKLLQRMKDAVDLTEGEKPAQDEKEKRQVINTNSTTEDKTENTVTFFAPVAAYVARGGSRGKKLSRKDLEKKRRKQRMNKLKPKKPKKKSKTAPSRSRPLQWRVVDDGPSDRSDRDRDRDRLERPAARGRGRSRGAPTRSRGRGQRSRGRGRGGPPVPRGRRTHQWQPKADE